MPKPTDYDKTHLRNMAAIGTRIDRIFKKAAEEAAKIGVSIKTALPEDKIFSFNDYPATRKQIERLMAALQESMETTIVNGVRSAWTLSNNKNNALVSRIFGDRVSDLSKEQYRRYFSTNGAALDAFLQRKTQGLNLSDRVWRYTDAFKREIELGLDLGIRTGESAAQMSRSLRQYLQHPDKLFRRVRDKHGLLRLSQAAQDFHPGRGVYRSSYKNARRLAATETNIAYRTSDHLRWQQMDFVVGIEICLSNNHTILLQPGERTDDKSQQRKDGSPKAGAVRPLTDICDTLAGRYPKDFKFTGWHPHCRCHVVTVLKTEEEMAEDTQRILAGEQPKKGSVNAVRDVPAAFKGWMEEHADRIEMGGNLPYFLADNRKRVDSILDLAAENKTLGLISQEKQEFINRFNNGEFNDYTDIIEYGKKHGIGSEYYPEVEYPEHIKDAIEQWQDEGDALVHMAQEGKAFKTLKLERYAENLRQQLNEAMDMYATDRDMVVYRVVRSDYKYDRRDYFVSCSTSPEAVGIFGAETKGAKIQAFLIPKGTRCIVVGNDYQKQFELIFNSRDVDFEAAKIRLNRTARIRTPQEIAIERHANRDAAKIQQAWNARRIASLEKATHNGLLPKECIESLRNLSQEELNARITFLQQRAARHAARTPQEIEDIKKAWEAKLTRDKHTRLMADNVLKLRSEYPHDVDFSTLEKLIADNNLTKMREEAKNVAQAIKAIRDEEKALSLILDNAHDWHKTYSLSELKQVYNAVEDKLTDWEMKGIDILSNPDKLKSKLEFEIQWLEKHKKHSTWQVAQDAYKKTLAEVETHIELTKLNAEYTALLGFKTTSKDFKDFMAKAKAAINAGDVKTAKSYIASAQWKKNVLEHNRKGKSGTSVKSKSSQFGDDAYSQKRKDAAMWAQDTEEADKRLRGKCGEVWRGASSQERGAIYGYTQSYCNINEPLRGLTYCGSATKKAEGLRRIPHIESIIDRSSYDFDMWLQRGDGMVALKKFGLTNWSNPTDADIMALLGAEGVEGAFWSAGVAKGKGFSGDIIFNIYAPKGTKAMYCEPFSAFGHGKGKNWDGIAEQSSYGYESEILIQRGTKFKITKIEKSGGTWYIDVDIIEQNPLPFPYVGGYPFK